MKPLTSYQFKLKAGRVHGLRYVYDLVDYKGSKVKVTIVCPLHGAFKQLPADHLRGYGCQACRTGKPPQPAGGPSGAGFGSDTGAVSGTSSKPMA